MNAVFEELKPYMDEYMALSTAIGIMEWDDETCAPEEANEYTAVAEGILAQKKIQALVNPNVKEILGRLEKEKNLNEFERAVIRRVSEQLKRNEKIPPEEMRKFSEIQSRAQRAWQQAKKEDDFSIFAPYLEKIIEFTKKFADYGNTDGKKRYDVCLNDFEEGFGMEELDPFFEELKREILPLLKEIKKAPPIDDQFLFLSYDIEKQREFNEWMADYIGFNFKRGIIAESEHPFTTGWHNHDVRITTHFYEKNMASAIFSTIHECGHAIYEQGNDDAYNLTILYGGASCGMHESQSRFMENVIGKSESFWKPIYGRLQETFPEQLGKVDLCQFIRAINRVKPDLIRIEADELTYCLHIMIRYELEKQMIEEDIDIEELPKLWDEKYQEYLGVTPDSEAKGILQDVHWSMGNIGYFPSYALGNAFAAQIYHQMKKDIDVDAALEAGDIQCVTGYLQEHIHRFGLSKKPKELLKELTGEEFNPHYYIDYLKEKYQKLYSLG